MKYETVNLDTWKRGNLFCLYIDNLRNVMSMTVDIDVSSLIAFARTHELKFYPAMMWVVSKAVNQRAEFRYGWDNNGNLIHWDYISPYYADFTSLMRVNILPLLLLGVNTKRKTEKSSCPYQ